MSERLYVGNLAYATMEHQLRDAFAAHGEVVSAAVAIDRMSGQSRGFGFVEFTSAEEAERAMEAMNGAMIDGRPIRVNPARERQGGAGWRGPGGGGGGGGRPRGGGGGGGREGGGRRPRGDRDRR